VGTLRDSLRTVDAELIEKTREHDQNHRLLAENHHELGRFHRMKNPNQKAIKLAIASALIITELVLAAQVFSEVIRDDIPLVGYGAAAGVVLLLVVIPHYVAQGLKEGLTRFHQFELEASERNGHALTASLERNVHVELQEDKVFRWIAAFLLAMLLAMIIPLSFLRAEHAGDGSLWYVLLYLFVQLGVSGYFFLREWNDLSNLCEAAEMSERLRASLITRRAAVVEDLNGAMAEFFAIGEDAVRIAKQAASWDRQLVDAYYSTIEHFRGTIATARPDLAPFLFWASRPAMDALTASPSRPLGGVEGEDADEIGGVPGGRTWWIEQLSSSVGASSSGDGDHAGWMVTKAPLKLLEYYLATVVDVRLEYSYPIDLDLSVDALAPATARLLVHPSRSTPPTGE
jgi:hypothetical protein